MRASNWIVSVFFIGFFLWVAALVLKIFSPFYEPIFWAALLAYAFYPIHGRLLKWVKGEWLAVFLSIFLILVLMTPFVLMLLKLSGQALTAVQDMTQAVRHGEFETSIRDLRSLPLVVWFEARFIKLDQYEQQLIDWLANSSQAVGTFVLLKAGELTRNVAGFLVATFICLWLTAVFLKDGHTVYNFIYRIVPMEEEDRKTIFAGISESFSAVIRGQLLTACVQGLVAAVIFELLGLPVPLLIGIATFAASMIPLFGTALIWAPFAVNLAMHHDYKRAVILTLCGIFIISLIDNLLKPWIIGDKTKLPYSLLCLGILGGVKMFGFSGAFLAPVLMALFFSLARVYRQKYLNQA
jgi:predicted PurR-regulated permease PerM